MRIAVFGSSLVSAYWNGACTYYRGIVRALHRLGHEVCFYEPDALERQRHRDIADPDWARVVVYDATSPQAVRDVVGTAAGRAEVVLKCSGVGIFDELLELAVLEERREGQLVGFWDVDAPATLARVEGSPADPFRELIGAYDLILTYGGGDPVLARYGALGARRCVAIYNALDPDTHHPVAARSELRSDLSLLANRLPDREARIEEFFFSAARALARRRFLLAGAGWEDGRTPANVRCLGHLAPGEHNAFNCSALAVLNVTRDSMVANGHSPATRVFEAAGAGACLISDAWDGLETFLEPGLEVIACASGEQVASALGSLDPASAREIGARARERMLDEHTYLHRARELDAVLQGWGGGAGAPASAAAGSAGAPAPAGGPGPAAPGPAAAPPPGRLASAAAP
jgi:spore maturation protein CgeB